MLQRKVIYHYGTTQNCLSSFFGNTESKSKLKETGQIKPSHLLSLYEAVAIAHPSPTCSPSIIHISFKTHQHRDQSVCYSTQENYFSRSACAEHKQIVCLHVTVIQYFPSV